MRLPVRLLIAASLFFTAALQAQSTSPQNADEIVARYVKALGGAERMQAVKGLRRVGKYEGEGGFEATLVQENIRPGSVRQEFTLQGMTQINAWDGTTGWKIDPFQGKKDAEPLSDEEMRSLLLEADFDDPLVNYREKGHNVEFAGTDQIEGTDVYKIKVALKNGDTRTYYLDTDSYVPIQIDDREMIRGSEQEFETTLGDYKEVAGWFVPFSLEVGRKGGSKGKITWEKIEPNVTIDNSRFHKPEIK